MTLQRLAAALDGARADGSLAREITAVVHDSRAVRPGALFVALRGARFDGGEFVRDAIARGASAVVLDEPHARALLPLPDGATAIVVDDEPRALSRLAAAFYGSPSRDVRVAGITGTNGKTTTTHFVSAILERAGVATGRIGTLGAHFGDAMWPLDNTTPLADELQRMLSEMRERGARAVAMEVSSHALALGRVADVTFAVAALTNLSREHLDFHGDMEAYAAAKRALFEQADRSVLPQDDPFGRAWSGELRAAARECTTYGFAPEADVRAVDLTLGDRTSFVVDGTRFGLALPGRFNVSNALAALCVARAFGVDDTTSAAALADFELVPGRMERVGDGSLDVLVDYAHTPDALAHVLRAARELARGRVIVVFGCGGDRDRGKRPQMGRIATELADRTIVTSDNPRGEDPRAIVDDVLAGATPGADLIAEPDRRAAIRRAVTGARSGDVVIVAGKGHETYQLVGGRSERFDDRDEVRAALAERARGVPSS
jgi:UDP-N-acetylmuramoyl-L-alanyl-D-glutamate--2,6-diaminopimelate ligase